MTKTLQQQIVDLWMTHTPMEIAEKLDVRPVYVYQTKRRVHQGYTLNQRVNRYRRSDHDPARIPRCVDCGKIRNANSIARCAACLLERRHATARQLFAHRSLVLKLWASRHGRLPTCTEARDLIGVRSRDTANHTMRKVFGPDPRDGSHRHAPRPLPWRTVRDAT